MCLPIETKCFYIAGTQVILQCVYKSDDDVKFRWFNNGELVDFSPTNVFFGAIDKVAHLVILNASPKWNKVTFRCDVLLVNGSKVVKSNNITITVQGMTNNYEI